MIKIINISKSNKDPKSRLSTQPKITEKTQMKLNLWNDNLHITCIVHNFDHIEFYTSFTFYACSRDVGVDKIK
jgi:hypothetical protein